MSIGIRNIVANSVNQSILNSNVLVDVTGLSVPLASSQRCNFKVWIPITLAGATSGIKLEMITTQAAVTWTASYSIFNGSTNAVDKITTQTAQAAVTGALLNAANHLALIWGTVVGNATPGVLKLQFAQNVVDAVNAATLLAGTTMEVVYF